MIRSDLKLSAALRSEGDPISEAIQHCNVILVSRAGVLKGQLGICGYQAMLAHPFIFFMLIDLILELVLLIQRVTKLRGSMFKCS